MNQRFPGPSELSVDEQDSMLASIEKRINGSTAKRTRRRIIGIAVLGSLLAGTTTVAAYGAISEQLLETPASIASPDPATADNQTAILDWTDELQRTARLSTDEETGNTRWVPGYGGIRASIDDSSVYVYWHGEVPPRIAAIIAAAPADISVVVVPCDFDSNELQAARDAVAERLTDRGSIGGLSFAGVGASRERDGLDLEVVTSEDGPKPDTAALLAAIADVTRVPVAHLRVLPPGWQDDMVAPAPTSPLPTLPPR